MHDNLEANSNIPVQVKVSRLAITAISFALSGLLLTLMLPFIVPRLGSFRIISILYCLIFVLLISAIVLGIISIIRIHRSVGEKTGGDFAVGAITIPLFTFLGLGILLPALAKMAQTAYRLDCSINLSTIGKAMLIYANDYDSKFPRAGGESSEWGQSVNYIAATRQQAYGLNPDDSGGLASISSSLYLLIKYMEVEPKSFICKDDKKVTAFKLKDNVDFNKLWDFGFEPWKHNSYSYHMPYTEKGLTSSSEPGLAVAADRNPWIPSDGWKVKDFTAFNPDRDSSDRFIGNSPVHFNEGQNVLYLDTHVNFEPVSYGGLLEDNIYTSWNGSDIRKGTPPKVGSQPADKLDSLLVNDPPAQKP